MTIEVDVFGNCLRCGRKVMTTGGCTCQIASPTYTLDPTYYQHTTGIVPTPKDKIQRALELLRRVQNSLMPTIIQRNCATHVCAELNEAIRILEEK